MKSADYEVTAPRADAMIQSLRAFGYDLATAIADLVDNSISAGARNVWIDFLWDGASSSMTLLDDGLGMSEIRLQNAMRPGSNNPLEVRTTGDLGRFGLGLKTASFSQAKSLTVGSKHDGTVSVRRWDMDYVTATCEWRLLKGGSDAFNARALPSLSGLPHGTVVFWELLDRLVSDTADRNDGKAQAQFYDRAEKVRSHLAMVFHRFLKPDIPGHKALKIWVGKQEVRAWDPYMSNEPSTRLLTEETLRLFGNSMEVRPYILPHHSKLPHEAHLRAAGPKGWNAQQGFYVYRNRRLLVAGSWLGLKDLRQEEHYKLARIMIDIPNSMDPSWEIDVKKSRAHPPAAIRDSLAMLATRTRSEASKAYRFRGARLQSHSKRDVVFLWDSETRHGKIGYRINRSHPIVQSALDAGGEAVASLLKFLEETVPIPTILQHGMENPSGQASPFENDHTDLKKALRKAYLRLIAIGETPEDARQTLAFMDPFYRFPDLIASLEGTS